MGDVINLRYSSRKVTNHELQSLYRQYPDLKGFLGNKYHIEHDGRDYWVMDDAGKVDLLLDLFVAIARSDNA